MEIRDLTKLEKEGLQEVAMSLRTESQTVIKKLAKKWVAMEMDIEELSQALHQKDEALHQKDEALHQKDEALDQLLKENERLKKLLEKQ